MDTQTARGFEQFDVGDYVVFERTFTPDDFAAFSKLTDDRNALYHDAAVAAGPFGAPIVPLHVALAPLSKIASGIVPGEQSLYLSHDVRASRPFHYGAPVRYSAKIESIDAGHRSIGLRVVATVGVEVVLDATMHVAVRAGAWSSQPALPLRKQTDAAVAVVTGAAGEIGLEIARALAARGWRLVLQHRGGEERRERMRAKLGRAASNAEFVTADLATAEGRAALVDAISGQDNLGLVVHAASPSVTAAVSELVDVNFTALDAVIGAAVPKMLERQDGAIVLVGSKATEASPRGWEAYAGVKTMAGNLVDGVDRAFAGYGVHGLTISPGFVSTRYSEAFRGDAPALMPGEVAEALVEFIGDRASGNVLVIDTGSRSRGRVGFHEASTTAESPADQEKKAAAPVFALATSRVASAVKSPATTSAAPAQAVAKESPPTPLIGEIVRKALKLPPTADLSGAGLGVTPGWDSLRHIELVLQLESGLGLRFSGQEMEGMQRFTDIEATCAKKLQDKAA